MKYIHYPAAEASQIVIFLRIISFQMYVNDSHLPMGSSGQAPSRTHKSGPTL